MRIVKRKEFLKLPASTVYAQGRRWVLGGLNVKLDLWSMDNDWYYRDFDSIRADDSNELTDRLEEMLLDSSASYPVEDAACRDGLYLEEDDDDDLFLIYEVPDIRDIVTSLTLAVDLLTQAERGEG